MTSQVECISRVLDDLPGGHGVEDCPTAPGDHYYNRLCSFPYTANERTMVGIATFDTAIQFYSLAAGRSVPSMMVVMDTTDVFVPDSAPLVRDGRRLGRVSLLHHW